MGLTDDFCWPPAGLNEFFGTRNRLFHVPNYNEKYFLENVKLFVMYTILFF